MTVSNIITIDGPSGVGKGTASKIIASKLGWQYLDSGALYRIVADASAQQGIAVDEGERLAALASALDIRFLMRPLIIEGQDSFITEVYVNDAEVSGRIYTEACGQRASKLATQTCLRRALLEVQRRFSVAEGLVADGRDMGTVVFPQAALKVFLTASVEERAKRRFIQLNEKGVDASIEKICSALIERDERDASREASPLKAAADAFVLDTTSLSIMDVVEKIMQRVNH